MTGLSLLKLNRLQITANEQIAYDQLFNKGINIIRGENGSGKSTIADFIFYVLGGEAINWKEEASKCDYVFAEIQTSGGLLTLERRVHSTPTETRVFLWVT
jgi:predicted ATPase